MTKEDLQQIAELMDTKLAPINEHLHTIDDHLRTIDERLDGIDEHLHTIDKRLDEIDERLDRLEENAEITRDAVNSLCEWADNVAVITQIRFPVKKTANGTGN